MAAIRKKYFHLMLLAILASTGVNAQYLKAPADSQDTKNKLTFYHTVTASKTTRQYLHPDYTRPNNQLMSWPNYPLTAWEIERRYRQDDVDSKLSNIIAKDIITSILSKKKKVAVIPKF
jgi:hypothetical protein